MLKIFFTLFILVSWVTAKDYFIKLSGLGFEYQNQLLANNWQAIPAFPKSALANSSFTLAKIKSATALPDSINKWMFLSLAGDDNQLLEDMRSNGIIEFYEPVGYFKIDFLSSDSLSNQQWYLDKIALADAWKITQGSADVIVAVIDTGIDFVHPDLRRSIWINDREDLNGNGQLDEEDINFIDDDNNGFVDDVVGWDFTDAARFADGGDFIDPDNLPWDEFGSGHGTQCAGIIAAQENNDRGIAGIAPYAKIMNLRAGTASGYLEEDDVARAVLYAIENGASIINMSFGDIALSRFLKDILNYAADRGLILVSSAGNSATDIPNYPSSLPRVISVGATNQNDQLASFSNYGNSIDIVAPGQDLISTSINGYNSVNGTSFSAPIVSAVAALVLSSENNIRSEQVRNILKSSADDILFGGWDTYSGSGRVSAGAALNVPQGGILEIIDPLPNVSIADEQVVVIGSAAHPDLIRTEVSYGSGKTPESWIILNTFENLQIINDTLALFAPSASDSILTIKVTLELYNGLSDETQHTFTIDRTPPVLGKVDIIPMMDKEQSAFIISFNTDDICTSEIKIKSKNEEDFTTISSPYETKNHRIKINSVQFAGDLQFYITAKNQSGLNTLADNNGQLYSVVLNSDINFSSFERLSWQLPPGYMLNFTTDLDHDGNKEIVISRYDSFSAFGKVELYEFNNNQFVLMATTNFNAIPRFAGDADQDGKSDLLLGYGQQSFLYEAQAENSFPDQIVWQDTANFWAATYADLDNDNVNEIIGKIDKSYVVLENAGDNLFSQQAVMDNPTEGGNILGPPQVVVTDLNGDGRSDLIFSDYDGDLISYTSNGDNQFNTLALGKTIHSTASESITYDADGNIYVASHTSESLNYEHEFDARYWTIEIFTKQDDTFNPSNEINIFGFANTREFDSGIAYHKFDERQLLFASFFPELYVFERVDSVWNLIWIYDEARSNTVLVEDFDKDGNDEFYFNNGQAIIGFTSQVQSRPAVPFGFSAQPLDSTQVRLKWHTVSSAQNYHIYRGENILGLQPFATSLSNLFIDSVGIGKKFFYAVTSIDSSFEESESLLSLTDSVQTSAMPKYTSHLFANNRQLFLRFDQRIKLSENFPLTIQRSSQGDFSSSALLSSSQQEILVSFANPFTTDEPESLIITNLFGESGVPLNFNDKVIPVIYQKRLEAPYVKSSSWQDERLTVTFSEVMNFAGVESRTFDIEPKGKTKTIEKVDSSYRSIRISFDNNTFIGAKGRPSYLNLDGLSSAEGIPIAGNTKVSLYVEINDLKNIIIYPQPVKPNHREIVFSNLPGDVDIIIYNIAGKPICC